MMHIGYRELADGQTRPVYLDDDGNQFVYGDDGRPVVGRRLTPDAEGTDPRAIARSRRTPQGE
jgi:hypothetical protein